jgi:hypothetical protein
MEGVSSIEVLKNVKCFNKISSRYIFSEPDCILRSFSTVSHEATIKNWLRTGYIKDQEIKARMKKRFHMQ